ncbi:hypothetical protein KIPB_016906, partial [Kipferlia bialata]
EAVATLIWSADYAEISDLAKLREMFAARYGADFVAITIANPTQVHMQVGRDAYEM